MASASSESSQSSLSAAPISAEPAVASKSSPNAEEIPALVTTSAPNNPRAFTVATAPSPARASDSDLPANLREGAAVTRKNFPNGDKYVGEWAGGAPHGTGRYSWVDGSVYDGEWDRGRKHGQGWFELPDGTRYEGEWKDGALQGVGSHWAPDGAFYTGNWAAGVKHGLGRKHYTNGDVYEGFWSRGVPDGPGRYRWSNGNEYFGEWEGGKISGYGTLSWANGDSYEGEWEAGLEHGAGTFKWADGSCFEGTWSRGLKDGKGLYFPRGYEEEEGEEEEEWVEEEGGGGGGEEKGETGRGGTGVEGEAEGAASEKEAAVAAGSGDAGAVGAAGVSAAAAGGGGAGAGGGKRGGRPLGRGLTMARGLSIGWKPADQKKPPQPHPQQQQQEADGGAATTGDGGATGVAGSGGGVGVEGGGRGGGGGGSASSGGPGDKAAGDGLSIDTTAAAATAVGTSHDNRPSTSGAIHTPSGGNKAIRPSSSAGVLTITPSGTGPKNFSRSVSVIGGGRAGALRDWKRKEALERQWAECELKLGKSESLPGPAPPLPRGARGMVGGRLWESCKERGGSVGSGWDEKVGRIAEEAAEVAGTGTGERGEEEVGKGRAEGEAGSAGVSVAGVTEGGLAVENVVVSSESGDVVTDGSGTATAAAAAAAAAAGGASEAVIEAEQKTEGQVTDREKVAKQGGDDATAAAPKLWRMWSKEKEKDRGTPQQQPSPQPQQQQQQQGEQGKKGRRWSLRSTKSTTAAKPSAPSLNLPHAASEGTLVSAGGGSTGINFRRSSVDSAATGGTSTTTAAAAAAAACASPSGHRQNKLSSKAAPAKLTRVFTMGPVPARENSGRVDSAVQSGGGLAGWVRGSSVGSANGEEWDEGRASAEGGDRGGSTAGGDSADRHTSSSHGESFSRFPYPAPYLLLFTRNPRERSTPHQATGRGSTSTPQAQHCQHYHHKQPLLSSHPFSPPLAAQESEAGGDSALDSLRSSAMFSSGRKQRQNRRHSKVVTVREYVQGVMVAEIPRSKLQHDLVGVMVAEIPRSKLQHDLVRRRGPTRRAGRKAGELIYKGHRSYDLMTAIQLGLRHSTGRATPPPVAPPSEAPPTTAPPPAAPTPNTPPTAAPASAAPASSAPPPVTPASSAAPSSSELRAEDFEAADRMWFPPEGSSCTPPHNTLPFTWRDYAPKAFRPSAAAPSSAELRAEDFEAADRMWFPPEGSSCTPPHNTLPFTWRDYAPKAFRPSGAPSPVAPSSAELRAEDFEAADRMWFPPEGSSCTPPHNTLPFTWRDYAPKAFSELRAMFGIDPADYTLELRAMFGIDPADYTLSLCRDNALRELSELRAMFGIDPADYTLSLCGDNALRELSSPGKSGSVFYLSDDDRFIIKTMRASEVKVSGTINTNTTTTSTATATTTAAAAAGAAAAAADMSPSDIPSSPERYRRRRRLHTVLSSPSTLIRFVVMANVFVTDLRMHRRFDLKGSSQGRSTEKVAVDETTTLKDLDLDLSFHMRASWRALIHK
ncbi:unnamed protein product [Closterium sp. Naga37s-1]|nr:unnamed protein product [Closterium sp. Naga37s-1]